MVEALEEYEMGQLLDIVPNHMGVGSDNAWWSDMLENGPPSAYAAFFDIDWCPADRKELRGKVLLPILGDHYRATLERGEIRLAFDAGEGSFSVNYYEHRYPIDSQTYPMILDRISLPDDDKHRQEIDGLIVAFGDLPGRDATGEESVSGRAQNAANLKADLAALCVKSPGVMGAVEKHIRELNDAPGDPRFERLHHLFEAQAYRLAYWRVGSDEINYRRFFAVNDLAGIRVEDERVFEATHRLVLGLVEKGAVNGLRIDHPDGLRDPADYLRRLRNAALEVSGGQIGGSTLDPSTRTRVFSETPIGSRKLKKGSNRGRACSPPQELGTGVVDFPHDRYAKEDTEDGRRVAGSAHLGAVSHNADEGYRAALQW